MVFFKIIFFVPAHQPRDCESTKQLQENFHHSNTLIRTSATLRRKSFCVRFLRAKLTVFLQSEAGIAVTSKTSKRLRTDSGSL